MGTDDFIDNAISMLLYSIMVPIFVMACLYYTNSKFGGFRTQLEKTAIRTEGELVDLDYDLDYADIMLALAIADEFQPEPKEFDIFGTQVKVDSNFLNNRLISMKNAYNALQPNMSNKFKLIISTNNNGMRNVKVVSK